LETLKKKRIVIILSCILITAIYWIVALWYNNKTGMSKDLVVFHWLAGLLSLNSPLLDMWQYIYQFTVTVLLFVFIPWLIARYYLHENFGQLCWRHNYNKTAVIICAVVYPLVIISTYFSPTDPTLVGEYPLSKLIGSSWLVFVAYEFAYFFYFFAYETFFRGYLQFGIMSDKPNTREIIFILLLQTVITTLFHIGKPGSEIMMAAVFGPIIGYVAIRFNSIWYGMIIHYVMNIFNDYFILQSLHKLPEKLF
jgi:hypothetical protein